VTKTVERIGDWKEVWLKKAIRIERLRKAEAEFFKNSL